MTDTKHPAREMPDETGPLWELTRAGQSVWLDYIRRGMLENGELEQMLTQYALRGVTSNPTIFEQAISGSDDYDAALQSAVYESVDAAAAFEALAVADIQRAADLFRGVYERTDGGDGFVSLEVSPELAHDTEATLAEARRLWQLVDRPNLMVKVPGTDAGLPAIEQLLSEGVNVNVTLLFSIAAHERVMEAYLRALETRRAGAQPLARVASVASFFVSRVDTLVDQQLQEKRRQASGEAERARIDALFGRAAIANAKLAYRRFTEVFSGERWERLHAAGARVQRPLWASTSTKNPAYRDVVYVEELIGPHTVNTMPLPTVQAFAEHGRVQRTLDQDYARAERELAALAELGIRLDAVTAQLLEEGVEKFAQSYRELLSCVQEKLVRVASGA